MTESPRILIFDRGLGNHYSLGLAGGLIRLGARVVVAGPKGDEREPAVAVYPRSGVPGQRAAKAVDAVAGAFRLVRTLVRMRPDVVHVQWASRLDNLLARLLVRVTGARLVFTVHNPLPRGWDARWQPELVERADAVIVHGPRLRDDLLARFGTPPAKVHVVPHGNHEHASRRYRRDEARRQLGLPLADPVFVFVGQLLPRKGLDTLLDAFRAHCAGGLPGTLVLAGPLYGVNRAELEQRVAPYGGRVTWLTADRDLPAETLDLALSAANLVTLPFHEASQSGSVILAMTHGRCVCTSRLGELPATLGGTGILVEPGDVDGVAEALALAASDPARCDELGSAARERALTELDWTASAAKTLEIYRHLVAESRS